MSTFCDNFWGEKNNGFDVLYQNMKCGHNSSREFSEFLRESCSVEEQYAKLLMKLANNISRCSNQGSFMPFWMILKCLIEKLSNLHMQLMHSWQDLMKEVNKYTDEQHRKHKAVKDSEAETLDTVNAIQQTTVAVHKAKDIYQARSVEYEKLKRDNASQKDVEKAEAKYKKAHEEYKALVEKYSQIRQEFESKMTESCKKYQEVEEEHLHQMKDFVNTYSKSWQNQHVLLGTVHKDWQISSEKLAVPHLIEELIKLKSTGTTRPGNINFEEADLSALPHPNSSPDSHHETVPHNKEIPKLEKPGSSGPFSTGLFVMKSRRKKRKDKKKAAKEEEVKNNPKETVTQVDEEGFTIRPDNPIDNHDDKGSWYSSSDSDSDSEDRGRKIKVEIKPFSPEGGTPTDNVADIRKYVEGMRLSPTTVKKQAATSEMKRSASETMNAAKPSQDLLLLDFEPSSTASTPTGNSYQFLSPGTGGNASNKSAAASNGSDRSTPVSSANVDTSIGANSIASPSNESLPSVPTPRFRSQTPTGSLTGAPLLPGPPPPSRSSRTNLPAMATARRTGRQSPALTTSQLEKTDSVPSLNSVTFNTTSAPIGSSRGPSPLTIGMSDTIPLAVAFSETINALFKGTEESNCRVKLTGDLMLSFPIGIARVLTDNPSPNVLSFKLKNTKCLEHVIINKRLLIQDAAQSTEDSSVYSFNMAALTEHLRREAEQSKTASYFNIDIIKYQVKPLAGVQSTPLQLVSYWKCENSHTDFRMDYRYNGYTLSHPTPLSNVTIIVPVDGQVKNMQAKPNALWSAEQKRAVWRLGEVSDLSEDGGMGSLHAKFELEGGGPSKPSTVAVQFLSEGTTLSGLEFELVGMGYRQSLLKKRILTGKYLSEAEPHKQGE